MSELRDRLRILWISHLIPYPPKGGVLMRSNYLATELARNNDVDLLALNQEKLLQSYYASNEEGLAAAKNELGKSFRKIHFYKFSSSKSESTKRLLALKSLFTKLPYSVACLTSKELEQGIIEATCGEEYDVVHFDTIGLAQFMNLATNVPLVLDHHNIESHMMIRRAQKERNVLKKLYFYQEGYRLQRYEKKVAPSFAGHITCSEVDGDRLVKMSKGVNVRVIPNSVRIDPDYNHLPGRGSGGSGKIKLLFIGGLDWYPNRDAVSHFLSEVWPIISRSGLEIEVNIIGKNPSEEIIDYARKYPGVNVHGFVDDIKAFYRDSDIFICPIRDGGGTKLKVLDAMAHSLPVIGYPEAFEGLAIDDGRDSLLCRSTQEFADQVVKLAGNSHQASSIGAQARRLIERKYEAEKVGKRLSDYYREIAARKPEPVLSVNRASMADG